MHGDRSRYVYRRSKGNADIGKGVTLKFIAPGKPTQNAFVESFNGTMREDCLNSNWFGTIEEARSVIENWREEHNGFRPHSSLKGMTPLEFARKE